VANGGDVVPTGGTAVTGSEGVDALTVALEGGDRRAAVAVLERAGDVREVRDPLLDLLAVRAAVGSTFAVELLVETVDRLRLAHRMVHGLLVDEMAIEDVAQDTLVAVATGIHAFRGDAAFATWLQRIARNRAIDHLRRQRATVPLEDHDVGDAVRVSSMIATQETARALIDQLPDHYRASMVLREIDRLPYAEVAEQLASNENTVRSHVARGRALLGRLVEGDEGRSPS
jgi:RNA polymerase sigma-70 factor, ECF subfamily